MIYFDRMRFEATLQVWRRMHELTQRDMAELAGMSASTYAFMETGERPPTMEQFVLLCNIMQFEPSYFFEAKKS